jgi:ATP phosphoribosyltransferase
MLRIALPNKGRLSGEVRSLFDDAGLSVRIAGDRALRATLNAGLEVMFVGARDIPEFVADGAADAGITGWDLVLESGRRVCDALDLRFGSCRLVVAAREDSGITGLELLPERCRVATVFPRLAESFFRDCGQSVEIIPVSGATEAAPHLGIADVVVDLVSSGSTLRVNGLVELCSLFDSSARLITPHASPSDPARAGALAELSATLASVVNARGKRYVMANMPRRSLGAIRDVLPGITGPTITDIMNGGDHVAVHAVVVADGIHQTLAKLKALGGEGILVTRIERLIA